MASDISKRTSAFSLRPSTGDITPGSKTDSRSPRFATFTVFSPSTPATLPTHLPRLHFTWSTRKLGAYIVFVMFCNLALPCIIFYVIKGTHKIDLRTNIGISSASLGLSSCFDAPFRLFRLTRFRERYGPLGDDVWWHADFFMWTYTFALFCFSFPLAIAPALSPLAVDFFLMATTMLVLPFGVVLAFTLTRARLPVWCSSDRPYTPLKPGMFYCLEDIGAVDFCEGKPWREACRDRYAVSPPFRSLMLILTYYWIIATVIYTGITAAVTWASWTLEFSFAFVLGQLFIWLAIASLGCWWIVHWGLHREKTWWTAQGGENGASERPVNTDVPDVSEVGHESERERTTKGPISDMTETRRGE